MQVPKNISILYIAYVDLEASATSGSGVRPYRILQQMTELGYDVTVLGGEQFRKERKREIKKIRRFLKRKKPDLCYIESHTYPIMKHADRKLIRVIHKMGIPIGYFYRDFYRKFPEQFPRRTSFMGRCKDLVLDVLQYLTDRILKNCDVVYVPSQQATSLLPYRRIGVLPPAGENKLTLQRRAEKNTAIYVGGIYGHYNGGLLLDSFSVLYEQNPLCKLLLVCREEEWAQLKHPQKNAPWLEVYHTSGEGLVPLYQRASVALVVPNVSFRYNDFAISVKVFEYISYGLPVVAVRTEALSQMVLGEGIGIVTDSTSEALAEGIRSLLGESEKRVALEQDVQKALLERNLWKHRIQKVVADLLPEGKGE